MTKYNWLFRKIRNFESTFWIKKLWSLLKKHSNLYTLKTCVFKKFGSTPAFIMYIWGAVSAWKLKTAIYNFLTLLCKMGYREIWIWKHSWSHKRWASIQILRIALIPIPKPYNQLSQSDPINYNSILL